MPDSPRSAAAEQWRRLRQDLRRQVFGQRARWLVVPFTPMTWVMAHHRFERAMFLTFGRRWRVLRFPLVPVLAVVHPWIGSCALSYEADIGGGLAVLHPNLGIVVPSGTTIGADAVLTGGNCFGQKGRDPVRIRLGDRVTLGANAVVLSPVTLGSDVLVGANAVVLHDFDGPGRLVGVPAHPVDSLAREASSETG